MVTIFNIIIKHRKSSFYIVIIVAIIIGSSYCHQEKGAKNYKPELTINTLLNQNNIL